MEYVPGGELYEYVKSKGGISEIEARKILKQLVYTVEYCHNKYVIHRDLKPSNILIYDQSTLDIKLIDFGISGSNYGKDKSMAGSLPYMPPEVLANDNTTADPAIDMWALGVILYFMVYGYLPFRGGSEKEIGKAILGSKVIFSEGKKKITEECKKLIKSLLVKDPKQRIKVTEVLQSEWFELPEDKIKELIKEEESKIPSKKVPIINIRSKVNTVHRKSSGESLVRSKPSKLFGTPNKLSKKSPPPSKSLVNKTVIKSREKK
jgi:serine/threonine protein kinase